MILGSTRNSTGEIPNVRNAISVMVAWGWFAALVALPIVTGPDKFAVICVGGHGTPQNDIFTCGHGGLVSREIRLPKNWAALVEKYRAKEIGRFRSGA